MQQSIFQSGLAHGSWSYILVTLTMIKNDAPDGIIQNNYFQNFPNNIFKYLYVHRKVEKINFAGVTSQNLLSGQEFQNIEC